VREEKAVKKGSKCGRSIGGGGDEYAAAPAIIPPRQSHDLLHHCPHQDRELDGGKVVAPVIEEGKENCLTILL